MPAQRIVRSSCRSASPQCSEASSTSTREPSPAEARAESSQLLRAESSQLLHLGYGPSAKVSGKVAARWADELSEPDSDGDIAFEMVEQASCSSTDAPLIGFGQRWADLASKSEDVESPLPSRPREESSSSAWSQQQAQGSRVEDAQQVTEFGWGQSASSWPQHHASGYATSWAQQEWQGQASSYAEARQWPATSQEWMSGQEQEAPQSQLCDATQGRWNNTAHRQGDSRSWRSSAEREPWSRREVAPARGAAAQRGTWSGRAGGQTESSRAQYDGKRQCQFLIGIEEEPKFRVARQLLGAGGGNVKRINQATGARLRLRGVGSKFLEGPEEQESSDPLMLCVSAPDAEGYKEAVRMVTEELERVYGEYRQFCARNRLPQPDLSVQMNEGCRERARWAQQAWQQM